MYKILPGYRTPTERLYTKYCDLLLYHSNVAAGFALVALHMISVFLPATTSTIVNPSFVCFPSTNGPFGGTKMINLWNLSLNIRWLSLRNVIFPAKTNDCFWNSKLGFNNAYYSHQTKNVKVCFLAWTFSFERDSAKSPPFVVGQWVIGSLPRTPTGPFAVS